MYHKPNNAHITEHKRNEIADEILALVAEFPLVTAAPVSFYRSLAFHGFFDVFTFLSDGPFLIFCTFFDGFGGGYLLEVAVEVWLRNMHLE